MRQNPVWYFHNRAGAVSQTLKMARSGNFNLVVGPPSSGKSAIVKKALALVKKDPPHGVTCVNLDLRGVGTGSKDSVCSAFLSAFKESFEPQSQVTKTTAQLGKAVRPMAPIVTASATAAATGVPIAIPTFLATLSDKMMSYNGQVTEPNPKGIPDALDILLETKLNRGEKVVIFIDEYARLFSEGRPDLVWKNDLALDLMECFIRHTKQRSGNNPATIIVTTSDQQHYDQFSNAVSKGFLETKCLGYMSDGESSDYLKEILGVEGEENRKKIVDHAGGHFTFLQQLAASPDLDAAIGDSMTTARGSLRKKLASIGDEYKNAFLKDIAPFISVNGGAVLLSDIKDENLLKSLLRHNVVSLRYPMAASPEWCADLPDFIKEECVTAFTPFERLAINKMVPGKKEEKKVE
jgi:hypothetical protein